MVKKVFIFILVAALAFIFYKKFLADILEPFFGKNKNNVDLYQLNYSEPEIKE
jgi:hypothetical protein